MSGHDPGVGLSLPRGGTLVQPVASGQFPLPEAWPGTSYSFSNRFALPLAILVRSSADNGMRCSQSVAGWFGANGQSTENMMWSTPSSCTHSSKAGSDQKPLVVT